MGAPATSTTGWRSGRYWRWAPASERVEEAVGHARGMLPPPQQLPQQPVRTLVENAVHAWDAGQAAETEGLPRRAVHTARGFGYL
jgi:hypothetical protein